jgi:hypothetical protein
MNSIIYSIAKTSDSAYLYIYYEVTKRCIPTNPQLITIHDKKSKIACRLASPIAFAPDFILTYNGVFALKTYFSL